MQTPVLYLTEDAGLLTFLNADFRDFQGIPAVDENPDKAILILTYAKLLESCGWKITHLIDKFIGIIGGY